jgi:hypothetical protein
MSTPYVSDSDVPAGTPHGYTYEDGIKHADAYNVSNKAYDQGFVDGRKEGVRVNRTPVWRRVAHYAVPVVTLLIGVGIGASMSGVTTATVPTIPTQPTRVVAPPAVTTAAPAADAKSKALDSLYVEAHNRGSLSSLSKDQLKAVMDNFVCKNINDLMAMSNGSKEYALSGSDAGFLWGANSVIGYC